MFGPLSLADNAHVTWFAPKGMRCGQRTLQHQSIEHAGCGLSARTAHRTITGADTNPPAQPFARMAEYLCEDAVDYSCCFTKFPFGSTLKQGLFTVRFDEHLVIPLTIGIVFP